MKWLYLGGVVLGIVILNKYNIAFLTLGFIPALLMTKQRAIFVTLVLCDNYGQAGAINYYSTKGIKAVSFNADYINWFDLSKKYENLIRVKDRPEDELQETGVFFKSSLLAGSVTNPFA